jgi:hypothetical protein
MVDMAIAATFVRELTEKQFGEQRQHRQTQRRMATASRSATGSGPAVREAGRGEGTRTGRILARLAQVRG